MSSSTTGMSSLSEKIRTVMAATSGLRQYAAFSRSFSIFSFAAAISLGVMAAAADAFGADGFAAVAVDAVAVDAVAVAEGGLHCLFGVRLRSASDLLPTCLLPLVTVASCLRRSCA